MGASAGAGEEDPWADAILETKLATEGNAIAHIVVWRCRPASCRIGQILCVQPSGPGRPYADKTERTAAR